MATDCDHKRYSCAEVGCIGDPPSVPEVQLWEMAFRGTDAEDAQTAKRELRRRGVLGWCPSCKTDCFVLNGTCRGCGAKVDPLHGERAVK